jgi:hypothetical protein
MKIIKKVFKNILKELGVYWAEFYASSSFLTRMFIMVFYTVVGVLALYFKYKYELSFTASLFVWLIIFISILASLHFLSTLQSMVMVVLGILFFALLVKQSLVLPVVAYFVIKIWVVHLIMGPSYRDKKKSTKDKGTNGTDPEDKNETK